MFHSSHILEFTNANVRFKIIFIHQNRPGVLRQVNSILGDHNVDKQTSDSRGDVAYLMADVSDVNLSEIKSLYESLESLSCMFIFHFYA